MINTFTSDPEDRLTSYRLLAERFIDCSDAQWHGTGQVVEVNNRSAAKEALPGSAM